jgi:hypothetical protein
MAQKKGKGMRDLIFLFGFIMVNVIVVATIGFVAMWRERHWK